MKYVLRTCDLWLYIAVKKYHGVRLVIYLFIIKKIVHEVQIKKRKNTTEGTAKCFGQWLLNWTTSDPDIWHAGSPLTLSIGQGRRSRSYVKVHQRIFFGYGCMLRRDAFPVVGRVLGEFYKRNQIQAVLDLLLHLVNTWQHAPCGSRSCK